MCCFVVAGFFVLQAVAFSHLLFYVHHKRFDYNYKYLYETVLHRTMVTQLKLCAGYFPLHFLACLMLHHTQISVFFNIFYSCNDLRESIGRNGMLYS